MYSYPNTHRGYQKGILDNGDHIMIEKIINLKINENTSKKNII